MFCGVCLCSIFLFHYQKVMKVRYLKLVGLIQLSDLCISLGAVIGGQRTGTFGCVYQYILTNIFPVCSCFLALIVLKELHYTVSLAKKVPDDSFSKSLTVAILIPVIVTFIPLSTEDIGTLDNEDGYGWCFLIPRGDQPSWLITFWVFFCVYTWVWISWIFTIITYFSIYFNMKRITSKQLRAHVGLSLYKLSGYPLTNGIFSIVPAYYDAQLTVNPRAIIKGAKYVAFFNYGFPFLRGTVNALVFATTNRELMYHWVYQMLIYFKLVSFHHTGEVVDDSASDFDHTDVPSVRDTDTAERITEMTVPSDIYSNSGGNSTDFQFNDGVKNPMGN